MSAQLIEAARVYREACAAADAAWRAASKALDDEARAAALVPLAEEADQRAEDAARAVLAAALEEP